MSQKTTRRRAEQLPSLTPSHIALHPNGYTTTHNKYTDIQHAHLLGEHYKVRRQGKIKTKQTPEQLKQLMKNHEQRTQDLLTGCDTSDTTTNGDSLTIHAEWPNHRKTGHVRAIFINANGLSPRHNNVELEYLIQSCAANQADIIGTVEVNQPLTTPSVCANMKDCVKTFDRYAKVQF